MWWHAYVFPPCCTHWLDTGDPVNRNEAQSAVLGQSGSLLVLGLCLTVPMGRGYHGCEGEGCGKLEQSEGELSWIQSTGPLPWLLPSDAKQAAITQMYRMIPRDTGPGDLEL